MSVISRIKRDNTTDPAYITNVIREYYEELYKLEILLNFEILCEKNKINRKVKYEWFLYLFLKIQS